MTEKEKSQAGLLYNSNYDKEIIAERRSCQKMCRDYNLIDPDDQDQRNQMLSRIIGQLDGEACIEQPFHCDMGYNIAIGKNFYANYNLVILDQAKVTIGSYVFIGPDCGIYTSGHPVNVKQRNEGLEYAKQVTIGNNVWIGGGVKIMPGVTIGDNTIIGSGSIVTKDIPTGVVAHGNPCRVVKELDPEDLSDS